MRRLFLAVTFAMALGASASAQAPLLPPPVADGVQQVIGAEQNQSVVFIKVGERLAVTLIGKPSTGAAWLIAQKPSTLSIPERTTGPTAPTSASGRPIWGASRWDVFTFEVTSVGEEVLRLEQRALQGAVVASFEVTVVAEAE